MSKQEFRIYFKNRQRYALLILGAILFMIGLGANLYFEEGELSFILGILNQKLIASQVENHCH
ncbi:MAG: hypothetical protein DWP98_11980 [Bacteroidetes bacterium]|nr:MAG: hypothetical protein DWP98_11980 [Bacteroidota bacterium]MBL1144249.1 hypothetical protein [Bacteroidota bacterium]NOG57045.1 hypothetical protein [Bacteroidota bacterium]